MRVYEITEFGIEGLRQRPRAEPTPGPGQVLVQVRATSLNYRDLLTLKGVYNPKQSLPLVPLSDGAGEVVAVGSDVDNLQPGDRVAGIFAQDWQDGHFRVQARRSTLGGPLDGMLAEQVLLPATGVVKVPGNLSFKEAACLPCAAVTAWNALMEQGRLRPGQTVLLLGTGGVSIFALQFAVLMGARAIVTSSRDEKLAKAKALGAWQTINYTERPDWDKVVLEMTAGRGVDHVVEVGGADTLARSLNAVCFSGRVSLIGVLAGVVTQLPVTLVLMKHVRLQGILVGSRQMFVNMNRAIEANQIKPVIDRVFDFDAAPQAFTYLESASHVGKVVVRMS